MSASTLTVGVFGTNDLLCDAARSALAVSRMKTVDVAGHDADGRGNGAVPRMDALVYCTDGPDLDVPSVIELAGSAPVVLVLSDVALRASRKAVLGGVLGVVQEARISSALAPTLHAACSGQLCVPPELFPGAARQPLSARERQVLGMVVMGFSNGEIARKLFLAESTVKSHLSSAFAKLNVRSRSEAAALILDPNTGIGVGILTIPAENGLNGRSSPALA